ncbi:retrovirus-related Pol polyprotein from transposon 412 [Trichonephila clavipes]|nr:retrovirus-related Pol polyprotein from transposon 412 [Trichonephila clavipes]
MKTRYDTKATGHQFKEGDKVWFYNPTRRKGISPKLQSHWDGPYTILKIINDVVIRIQDFVATQVQLKDKYLRLETAQEAVSGTLLQLEDNGEEFEADFTDAESYRGKYLEYYTHIDTRLGETVISEVPDRPRSLSYRNSN